MFEKFTDSARRCLFVARAKAAERGGDLISSDDLLAGIVVVAPQTILELGGTATAALTATESIEELLQRLERQIESWEARTSKIGRFTNSATVALNRAIEESEALGHNYVGPEHILTALLSDEGTRAWSQLNEAGLRLSAVRERMRNK